MPYLKYLTSAHRTCIWFEGSKNLRSRDEGPYRPLQDTAGGRMGRSTVRFRARTKHFLLLSCGSRLNPWVQMPTL